MLVGRERERRAHRAALASARSGASATLALVGEAGNREDRAARLTPPSTPPGCASCAPAGSSPRRRFRSRPCSSCSAPRWSCSIGSPSRRRSRSRRALALRRGPSQERFAVGAATLSLLAAYAEEGPVAVLVDDAHWLDGSSAQALLFAFRRLVADPIAVLIAVREGDPSLLDGADLPTLRLAGLTSGEAATSAGRDDGPAAAERLHGATAGQPARADRARRRRRQMSRSLQRARRCSCLPASRDAFLRRLGELDESARRALVLAGNQRQRRSADARTGGGPARNRSGGARGRRSGWALDAEAGVGRVPPPAGAVGGLRCRSDRGAARSPPGAGRRAARPRRRSPRVAPGRGGGRHRTTRLRRRSSRPASAAATEARTPPRRPRSSGRRGSRATASGEPACCSKPPKPGGTPGWPTAPARYSRRPARPRPIRPRPSRSTISPATSRFAEARDASGMRS